MNLFNDNSQINAVGGISASTPAGFDSCAYANLLSGSSGLKGLNLNSTAAGSDNVKLGSEASTLMGATGSSDPTSFIMQMINKLNSSSNAIAAQLMSSMSGTGSTGTTGTTGGSGSGSLTGAGKLDTTGVQNSQRQASGKNEVGGGQIITSGTVNNTMGTTEITSDYVRADGKPSAAGDGAYKTQAGPVFENRCPCCGKKGVLSYERSTQGNGCPEGMFFCDSKKGGCDADFSVISGKDHGSKKSLTKVDLSKTAVKTTTGSSTAGNATSAVNATNTANTANATNAAGFDTLFPNLNLPGIVIPRSDDN